MMSPLNFQRAGSISNAHVGRDFEVIAQAIFHQKGIQLSLNHAIGVGVSSSKKLHAFDLGCDDPKIIVECKSHRWTAGGNIPSAKLTVWNEAMFYFFLAPAEYRKIFFILRDCRQGSDEALSAYYLRNYGHLVPNDVEFWEYDECTQEVTIISKLNK